MFRAQDYKADIANDDFLRPDFGSQPDEKSLAQRWFGPLTPGGFRSSLLTLCSSMIGVGFLTLPVIGKNSGLYPMIGLILLSAGISLFANVQISRGYRFTQGKTYSKIVARVDGRLSAVVNMIFLLLYVYVSAGAYYVFGRILFSTKERSSLGMLSRASMHGQLG